MYTYIFCDTQEKKNEKLTIKLSLLEKPKQILKFSLKTL